MEDFMKLLKFFILSIFGIVLLITACSNNSTAPIVVTETIKDYFPTTINSYWKYNVYSTDSTGTWDVTSLTVEKWLVTATTTKFNKSATELTPVDETNKAVDSPNYFAVEGNKIYSLPSYIVPKTNFQLPLNLADAWYLIADKDGSSWSLGSQQIKDLSVPVPGYGTVVLNGTLTINCKKNGAMKDVKWGATLDKTNSAQDYTLEYAFDGNTTVIGLTVPVKFTAITHNWYSKSIGLIRATLDPLTITVTMLGSQVFNMQGNDKVLTEYNIAK